MYKLQKNVCYFEINCIILGFRDSAVNKLVGANHLVDTMLMSYDDSIKKCKILYTKL